MRMTYSTACVFSAASHTPPQYARTLNGRCVPWAVLHGDRVLRVRLLQGCQSPLAWCYSLSHDTTHKDGSHMLSKNSSVRGSKEFNDFFSSRPAKWVMHERAVRQWVTCPSLSPCFQAGQPSVLADEDCNSVYPQAWHTVTTA